MARGTDEGTRVDLDRPAFPGADEPSRGVHALELHDAKRSARHAHRRAVAALHRHAPLVACFDSASGPPAPRSRSRSRCGSPKWARSTVARGAGAGHRWRLHFDARGCRSAPDDGLEAETDGVLYPTRPWRPPQAIRAVFADGASAPAASSPRLEERLGYGKQAWPIDTLRHLADVLIATAPGRARSAAHEVRWLNLAGFCVRPGFGAAADRWRIGELRKVYTAGLAFPKDVQAQAEWLVLWQRTGGGFSAGSSRSSRGGSSRRSASARASRRGSSRRSSGRAGACWHPRTARRRHAGPRGRRMAERLVAARNGSLLWSLGRVGARVSLLRAARSGCTTRGRGALDRHAPRSEARQGRDRRGCDRAGGHDGDAARDIGPAALARCSLRAPRGRCGRRDH